MNKPFEKLFEPGQIGKMKIKNRIVMPPMVMNYAGLNGEVTDTMINYYQERARGGVGLIIVEATEVDYPNGLATAIPLAIHQDRYIAGLNRLVQAIHMYGAKAALQLHHGGRQAFIMEGQQPVAPSPIPCKVKQTLPRKLTIKEIEVLVEKFSQATLRAKTAGFDAIQIHGAHGYLITQFMSPYTNKRQDKYGGTFKKRMRFPLEIIQRTRELVGNDFPIIFRISADEFVKGGLTLEDSKHIAKTLEEAGINAIDVSAGIYESLFKIIEPMSYPEGWRVYLAEEIKKIVSIPVITVGQIRSPEFAESIIAKGKADFVALGRALIADPYWPQKARENKVNEIRHCLSCNIGCLGRIFSSLPAACTVNAQVGREKEFGIKLAEKKKKIMVVGGGPAGMEAARVASLRGHEVTLYEKNRQLGGQLIVAAASPGKDKISHLNKYYSGQLKKAGVKIILDRKVDERLVEEVKPDVLIIATGSEPFIPDIPGISGKNVLVYQDVLSGKVKVLGEKVVVAGGGMVGCDTALYLASQGKKVIIVEKQEALAMDMEITNRLDLILESLPKAGVQFLLNRTIAEISEKGIMTLDRQRKKFFIEADKVVIALGTKSVDALEKKARNIVSEVHIIGDSKKPRQIIDAIFEGAVVAQSLI
ncbi:MAG: NADH oxidase [candidate division WS2 bacterium]|uniref:NADH oxidase n=1 Tax=Psychracetigena formicireducens TaxID=2986056 RepID=A0A9E2BI42_PSYF1|nr:NADH oxidase [Candidatus Psychracetigena formicireducens]MBT9145968.1 NADH oxidase [Candidatus Psychracetigena formicireducens]